MLEKVREYSVLYQNENSTEVENPSLKLKKVKPTKEDLSLLFGAKVQSPTSNMGSAEEKEIRNYKLEESIYLNDDPLEWWMKNEKRYPSLSLLAKHLLAIPATSVPSERMFSKAGCILNNKRSSLSSEMANQLIFLSHNRKKVTDSKCKEFSV